ncbi:c-type cytochrome [Salinithrix halophila]|uniref:C-type cytochrome n=1 Tax=Salinithrix halophila TaxID=1485204 RepID=A0ABV8JF87_9BACL
MWRSVLGGAVVMVALSACGQQQGGSDGGASETASPKEIYASNCMSCHGEKMEGSVGPALDKVGAQYSKKEIAAIIQRGKGQMPAQNQVGNAERDKLAAWLAKKK